MSWHRPGLRQVRFEVLAAHCPGLAVQVSDDGASWRTIRTKVERGERVADGIRFTVSAGTSVADHVRVIWTGPPAGRDRTGLLRATLRADVGRLTVDDVRAYPF